MSSGLQKVCSVKAWTCVQSSGEQLYVSHEWLAQSGELRIDSAQGSQECCQRQGPAPELHREPRELLLWVCFVAKSTESFLWIGHKPPLNL